ncbi:hypothetical protein SAY86_014725 [Trapa natans]|uniref:Uncharacterized protein n=1 Tax=Trapa natans TaxID=22666 RepID=A0AAN7KGD6_TRANT|nr:hypothetical protein SAY86_014725 [Trapa natans]
MSSSSEQHLLFNHSSPAIPPARSVLRSPNSDHFYKLTPFSSTSSSTSITNPPFTGHEAASCTTSDVSSSMDLDRIHPHQQQMPINDLQGFSPPYNRESEIFSGDLKIANYRVGIPMDRYGIEEISQLISGSSPYSNVATLDNNNSSYNSMIRELISSSSYHSNAATSGNNDCSYNSFLFGGVENSSIMTSDSPNLDTGADEGFLYYNY